MIPQYVIWFFAGYGGFSFIRDVIVMFSATRK